MVTVTEIAERDRSFDMEEVFTPEEAAERLKLNPETIRRYLRDGTIKGYQVGRVWRIPESALAQWLETTSNRRPGYQPPTGDAEE